MTYTKPWTTENSVADDAWHQWLAVNAHSGLEYQLLYHLDHIALEFFDTDQSEAFAQEFGL